MNRALTLFSVLLCAAGTLAQSAPPSGGGAGHARAVIEGIVVKDPGSEPVKKALIELIAENQNEGGDYTAITGANGGFRIENIAPGRYHLFAERTGYLEVDKHRTRTDGRVVTLTAGQELKDVSIRLQAASVVQGRVTDEDGDPLPNAQVAVLCQTYASGRSHWEQAGGERTNDLGEYRVAGLAAGNYYVSVSPPPDFKSLIDAASNLASVESANDSRGASSTEKPAATSYQTTYYPGTRDRSQATPIVLHAGDEFPVNFSLTPSPSLTIRGSVANLPPRASAAIMLQSLDFNLMLNGAEMHSDGSFVIRDVAPGAYTITATVENSSVPMMARQALQVISDNVDGLRLAPQTGAWIHGRLRLESKNGGRLDASQLFLMLRSTDGEDDSGGAFAIGGFSNLAHVSVDGSFEWKSVPPGNYFVELAGDAGATADWFLKSALAGGRDVVNSGLSVSGGAIALDLVASASGAVVDGVAANSKGEPVANAVIVAVPEARLRGRVDHYRKTVSDQSGRFTLHGVPPGDYTLFVWESVDGEAYYNPEFISAYAAQGKTLHVNEGDHASMQLQAIPATEDQQ
jgi:protocatechuate 3,4-dioxygenase beta subunit